MNNMVNGSILHSAPSPEAIIDAMDRRARRYETPCSDGTMVWRIWCEGPPLLLLHGGHGSWTHWIRNIDALAAQHRVIAPDLPGFGDSALPPRKDDGESFAEVIAEGLRKLPGDNIPIDIVGFSTGGVIAAHLAAIASDLVRRLILVDVGGLGTPLVKRPRSRVRGLEGDELAAAHRANLLELMLHYPESVDDLAIHVQATNVPRGRASPATLVLPQWLKELLPRVKAQVDAIWGEHDRPHPMLAQREALREQRPDAQFHVIPGAGHWSMYEGSEAFNATLRGLLEQKLRVR